MTWGMELLFVDLFVDPAEGLEKVVDVEILG